MKKKSAALTLVAAIALFSLFAGCAEGADPDTRSSDSPAAVSDTGNGQNAEVIVYTQKTMDQFFHVALEQGVQRSVNAAGYSFESSNCNNDSTLQNNQMQNFMGQSLFLWDLGFLV